MVSRFCLEQLCVGGTICQNGKSKKDRSLKKFFFMFKMAVRNTRVPMKSS